MLHRAPERTDLSFDAWNYEFFRNAKSNYFRPIPPADSSNTLHVLNCMPMVSHINFDIADSPMRSRVHASESATCSVQITEHNQGHRTGCPARAEFMFYCHNQASNYILYAVDNESTLVKVAQL